MNIFTYMTWHDDMCAFSTVSDCLAALWTVAARLLCPVRFRARILRWVCRSLPPNSGIKPAYLVSHTIAWGNRFLPLCHLAAFLFYIYFPEYFSRSKFLETVLNQASNWSWRILSVIFICWKWLNFLYICFHVIWEGAPSGVTFQWT